MCSAARVRQVSHGRGERADTLGIARSARVVAQLEKPLERIASAASLSIVESLDDISVDVLNDWLDGGRSAFVDHINKQWRLRRDVGVA